MKAQTRALTVAAAAVALALTWQALAVHYCFAGHWNGLFNTGERFQPPPEALAPEQIYAEPNSTGYDGQMYHYLAHDPFLRRGFWKSFDAPPLRSRRWLVPLLAWTLAAGQDGWIDPAYDAVILVFVGLGVYWLARLALQSGQTPWVGLAFLVVPSTVMAFDKMTVDITVGAFCLGFVLSLEEGAVGTAIAIAALAALARETGIPIAAAGALFMLSQRRWVQAVAFAGSLAPAFFWYLYVALTVRAVAGPRVSWIPLQGIAHRLLTPTHYPVVGWLDAILIAADYASLMGCVLTFVWFLSDARPRLREPAGILLGLYLVLATFLNYDAAWMYLSGWGRILPALSLLPLVYALRERRWLPAMPFILAAPITLALLGKRGLSMLGILLQ